MYDIMMLPEASLRQALPKVSVRMLMRLLTAYPRAIGGPMLMILSETMSPQTLMFLKQEINGAQLPTLEQIREAELELIKAIHDQNLAATRSNS
jgi:hypothetical protein